MSRDRVVVVSPHLDDAVLSAWLVLTGGSGVEVLTCFAGLPPDGSPTGTWDVATGRARGAEAVRLRRDEDRAALALCGARPIHLDLPDAQYRAPDAAPVVPHLAELLRDHLHGADEVWLPAGLGGHADHVATRRACLAVTGPGLRRRMYADLPYAAQPAWPAEVTGGARDRAVELLGPLARLPVPAVTWRAVLDEVPGVSVAPTRLHRLTRSQVAGKWAAVRRYESQLAALRCGRRNVLRRRRVLAHEASWSLS